MITNSKNEPILTIEDLLNDDEFIKGLVSKLNSIATENNIIFTLNKGDL